MSCLAAVLTLQSNTDTENHIDLQSLARLVGNILLVYSYHDHYKSTDTVEWGYILQGLGYSFLVSATLGFYGRATTDGSTMLAASMMPSGIVSSILNARAGNNQQTAQAKPPLQKLLHLVNFAALILLITGYTDSDDLFASLTSTSSGTATLNVKAKIGDVVFLGLTVFLALLTAFKLMKKSQQTSEQNTILKFIAAALPFMTVRVVYVAYQSFTKDPFRRNLAVKVVLQFTMEVIINVVYCIMGFVINRQSQSWDVEMARATY